MKSILNLICSLWTTTMVTVLRALHTWSQRQYHRVLLRRELRRIGKEVAESRKLKAERQPGEIVAISRAKEDGGQRLRCTGGTNG